MSKYTELVKELIKASQSYYIDNISLMSDYEFDMKMKELEAIELKQGFADPDSPTQNVGSDLIHSKEDNTHKRPMLSLSNTYTLEEVEKWYIDICNALHKNNVQTVVDLKYDGASAAIRYNNGKIIKSLSRGSKIVGEDMTDNISRCSKFWNKIDNFSGEVRGEVIINDKDFDIINNERLKLGKQQFQNARNLVSGSLKILDKNEFLERAPYIKFYAYWLEDSNNILYSEDLESLKSFGFNVGKYFVCKTFEDIKNAIIEIENLKINSKIPVAIDGAVIKIDNKRDWDVLGNTATAPRWAKAYKYHQQKETSKVVKIEFNTGRSGKCTPLIWFEPKLLDGSTVEKATMNNYDFYNNMNIAVGDTVEFQKAAAIIPQITKVINRPSDRVVVKFPTKCPSCGTKLEKRNEEHTDMFCNNELCPSRIVNQIINYTHMLEIDGFGEILTERLNENGYLNSISDLYRLKDNKIKISTLERLSEKTIKNLCENVEKQKTVEFWKVIAGLGIPNVGPKTAKALAKYFKTMKVLQSATSIELQSVEDIGEIVADSIVLYFRNNRKLIQELTDFGVNMSSENINEEKATIDLSEKSFCITGALSLTRDKYINLIESCGGKVVGGVSSKTSYLITNDKTTGTTKNKKAAELGIPILNEKELLEMCDALHLLKELESGGF